MIVRVRSLMRLPTVADARACRVAGAFGAPTAYSEGMNDKNEEAIALKWTLLVDESGAPSADRPRGRGLLCAPSTIVGCSNLGSMRARARLTPPSLALTLPHG